MLENNLPLGLFLHKPAFYFLNTLINPVVVGLGLVTQRSWVRYFDSRPDHLPPLFSKLLANIILL